MFTREDWDESTTEARRKALLNNPSIPQHMREVERLASLGFDDLPPYVYNLDLRLSEYE